VRRKLIDAAKASLEFRPGDPAPFTPGFEPVTRPRDVNLSGMPITKATPATLPWWIESAT